jgi:hypothetical protein
MTIENKYGDYIVKRYVEDRVGSPTIAKEIGCHHVSILEILEKRGVSRRSSSDYKHKHSKETREKISKNNACYWKGRTKRIKVNCEYCGKEIERVPSEIKRGKYFFCSREHKDIYQKGENHPNWNNGSSFEPYCILFSNEFKERVREFWGRKCVMSGITEEEHGSKLSVHHVSYDKETCCNITPPLFIPVTKGWNAKFNENREYWEEYLTNYIMIWFDGECYLPKEDIL